MDTNDPSTEVGMPLQLFHYLAGETRSNSPSKGILIPDNEHQSNRVPSLAETTIYNRSCNGSNFSNPNTDSTIEDEQECLPNISLQSNGSGWDPKNTSTPEKESMGRPQRTRRVPDRYGDYVLY